MKKAVVMGTSSEYVFAAATVIIGIEKYSPGLVDNYIIYYSEDDPLEKKDFKAFKRISNKVIFKEFHSKYELPEYLKTRFTSIVLARMHIFNLLNEYNQVLFLDTDVLIRDDISELFHSFGPLSFRLTDFFLKDFFSNKPEFKVNNFSARMPNSGVVFIDDRLDLTIDYEKILYKLMEDTIDLPGKSGGPDEVPFGLMADNLGIEINPLPWIYNSFVQWDDKSNDAIIVHPVGGDIKFWNNRLTGLLYPEWSENYFLWVEYGGSRFTGDVKSSNLLCDTMEESRKRLEFLIGKHEYYPDKHFDSILEYAEDFNSWSSINLFEKADIVCAYGVGKYFIDLLKCRKFTRQIRYCCDRDESRGKALAKNFGIEYLTIENLEKLNKKHRVVVVVFIGNLSVQNTVMNVFKTKGIHAVTALDCIRDEIFSVRFSEQDDIKRDLLTAYSFFEDASSKSTFADVIANRVSPGKELFPYSVLKTGGRYFNRTIMDIKHNEKFCSCGAYIGDTIRTLLQETNGCFDYIYAYEMAEDNFRILKKNMRKLESEYKYLNEESYSLFNAAVWDKSCKILYGNEDESSSFSYSVFKENNVHETRAVTIDETAENATFIVMNVEGAELNVLHGAENTIKTNHPKLAVTIDHKLENFWKIPFYIKEIAPDYKLYIRHHSDGVAGTVLYGI